MSDIYQGIIVQWRRSIILRLGILIIAVLLVLLSVDNLSRIRNEKIDELQEYQSSNARKKTIAEDKELPLLDEKLKRQRALLERCFIHAKTAGLAQAAIRSKLLEIIRRHNLPAGELKIESPIPVNSIANCYAVTVIYHATTNPAKLFRLLGDLEKSPLLIVIDRFTFWATTEKNSFLVCRLFYIVEQ